MLDAEISRCAPEIAPVLMRALVRAESAGQPLAIGMDAGRRSVPQPRTLAEALAVAEALATRGETFSVGLAQIHVSNVRRYGLSWAQAFDGCTSLATGQRVLRYFLRRASNAGYEGPSVLRAALRGYNSGSVHSSAADGYASRVLGYMAGTLQVSSAAFPPPPAMTRVNREPGESLDIFEKAADAPGFWPGNPRSALSTALR